MRSAFAASSCLGRARSPRPRGRGRKPKWPAPEQVRRQVAPRVHSVNRCGLGHLTVHVLGTHIKTPLWPSAFGLIVWPNLSAEVMPSSRESRGGAGGVVVATSNSNMRTVRLQVETGMLSFFSYSATCCQQLDTLFVCCNSSLTTDKSID